MKFLKYFEGKQVGILYHYTNPGAALSILFNDYLDIGQYRSISFTRNKNYHLKKDLVKEGGVRFVFNGDGLSKNNKIEPHSYWGKNKSRKPKSVYNEYEERCMTRMDNIKKYIIEVNIDKLKCLQWFVSNSLVSGYIGSKQLLEAEKVGTQRYKIFLKDMKFLYPNIKYEKFYK